jgi:hypothetical protein
VRAQKCMGHGWKICSLTNMKLLCLLRRSLSAGRFLSLSEMPSKCYNQSMSLSTQIRGYFWDINPDTASPKKHPRYYITRILEEGNKRAVHWLFRMFGKSKVMNLLPTLRLSDKSANYWRYYFSNSSEK